VYFGHHSWITLVVLAVGFLVRASMMNRRRGHRHDRSSAPGLVDEGAPRSGPRPGRPPDPPTGAAPSGVAGGTPPGWYRDPFVRHEERYWSGSAWTDHVTDDGTPSTDPPPPPRGGAGPAA
jgi:hypothetical protein